MSTGSPHQPPPSPHPSTSTSTTLVNTAQSPSRPLSHQPPPSTTTTTTISTTTFAFPALYSFPPFFTLQPVLSTRTSQLTSWSALIQSYCRHHRLWTLVLVDALDTPLFHNRDIGRRLSLRDARSVVAWMSSPEGGGRAEFISSSTSSSTSSTSALKKSRVANAADADSEAGSCYIYWRSPAEWASVLEDWVERTGQKGVVLTLYEIGEGDATRREEFWGMEERLLRKVVEVCSKRGRAQVFGSEGAEGVKFF
ncbi:ESCRT-II-domain-containing protein [Lophiostoma macrostomum CBS 122681]|uniref:Vacuolar protein-sorting-associated protein 25 n=1 Tax=Lophiostoma macrostomum CBS 122681 TaxID=1314788 RepID=A0A6A6TPR6_9PLEO|nr:ESCRT-II-domain-containing protein [Lophiostoma macrostomum CBS 122681]